MTAGDTRGRPFEVTSPIQLAAAERYLDLLKRSLTGALSRDVIAPVSRPRRGPKRLLYDLLHSQNLQLGRLVTADPAQVQEGRPAVEYLGYTMVGRKRLDNVQACVEDVLRTGVAGDLIEAGVWRGGTAIFMRAVLAAHGVTDRILWAADSFEGLPEPAPSSYPADRPEVYSGFKDLSVSLDEVRRAFARHGLLDDQVQFLEGWFSDTLATLRDRHWAVIRLDGDTYQSTMESLQHLYPQLSVGGYIIVDDYGALEPCRQAVEDFRSRNEVAAPIKKIDWTGAFWQRDS